MHILVINCGSSSLKADIINTINKETVAELRVERISTTPEIKINQNEIAYTGIVNTEEIIRFSLIQLKIFQHTNK